MSGDGTISVREREPDAPGRGEVQVRMRLAPINPSDFNFVNGTYRDALAPLAWNRGKDEPRYAPEGDVCPAPPYALGGEGVGVVESAGPGWWGARLVGKRVAVVAPPPRGTWQELACVDAGRAIPVPAAMPDEQAASFFVNPLTALAMVRHVLRVPRGGWLLQTAAGSALSSMVRALAKEDGFFVIAVVRSAAGADRLRAGGVEAVIATDETPLSEGLQRYAPNGVGYALDCVGGPLGAEVLRCMRPAGHVLSYGTLSGEPVSFSPRDLIMPTLRYEGFYLPGWLARQSMLTRLRLIRDAIRLINNGTFATPVQATYTLDQLDEALAAAQRTGRTGKILLRLAD